MRRVTCVDKANVFRSYAFFRQVFQETARDFPDVRTDFAYVDAMTMYAIQTPARYDVIVLENMFGDILSDLGAATVGGLGMAPSGDIGDRYALFQPSHGTAPDIAGRGIANPMAAILSAALMCRWLGQQHNDAAAIRAGGADRRRRGRGAHRSARAPAGHRRHRLHARGHRRRDQGAVTRRGPRRPPPSLPHKPRIAPAEPALERGNASSVR